jgi:hypothetical protein
VYVYVLGGVHSVAAGIDQIEGCCGGREIVCAALFLGADAGGRAKEGTEGRGQAGVAADDVSDCGALFSLLVVVAAAEVVVVVFLSVPLGGGTD